MSFDLIDSECKTLDKSDNENVAHNCSCSIRGHNVAFVSDKGIWGQRKLYSSAHVHFKHAENIQLVDPGTSMEMNTQDNPAVDHTTLGCVGFQKNYDNNL